MKQLKAIKVLIKKEKGLKYPNFNQLEVVKSFNDDWTKYVDYEGSGWIYDKKSNANVDDGESSDGYICGMILVPEDFANEADKLFKEVSILSADEAELFYNTRFAIDLPDEEIDLEELQKIKIKKDLGLKLTQQQQKAIDPTDNANGIRINKKKTFAGYMEINGITTI